MAEGIRETPRHFVALAGAFRGRPVGHAIVWKEATASTMDDARRLAAAGAAEGTVVGADAQSAGRGRHGRGWVSRPGEDLLVSVILRPGRGAAARLSMLAGLAAAGAVDRLAGVRSAIKWPNDVRVGGRKVCGVLVETAVEGPAFSAVVGFGLNVNLEPAAWPEISSTATSLRQIRGQPGSRVEALQVLLEELNGLHGLVTAGDTLRERWAARVDTLGQQVELLAGGETLRGYADGIDYDGGLLVRLQDGTVRTFMAGEVTVQSPR